VKLDLSPAETQFKEHISGFIDINFPPAIRDSPSPSELAHWHDAVAKKGWTAPEWESCTGGPGWNPMEIYLWYSLTTEAHCPLPDYCGLQIVGPLILRYSDPPLHQLEIEGILNHSMTWGSAFFPGDSYISATETGSGYELSGHLPCYSMTGPPARVLVLGNTGMAHTLFIIDPHQTGIQLSFNELQGPISMLKMHKVHVPESARLGRRDLGLEHLSQLLTEEQSISTVANLKSSLYGLEKIIEDASLEQEFEIRTAEYEIELRGLEITALRSLDKDHRRNLQAVNSRVEKLRLEINDSINSALGYYSIPQPSVTPGQNEPVLGTSSLSQLSKQIDPFSNCPEGFREDLIAKTILGL
jgi:alkylation response protein AidB-like acyl-CoA dehydrogenase